MARTSLTEDGEPPAILCAGIAAIDQIFSLDRFPVEGTKSRARDLVTVGGGCAANAAVAVTRLGGRARLAAPLGGPQGSDLAGDAILAHLHREGIDTSDCLRHAGIASPVSAALVTAAGERTIVNYRDEALSQVRCEDPDSLVAGVRAVLIDNRFPEFVLPIALAARRQGRIVLMDADPPRGLAAELMAASTHVIFSAHGLRGTAGCDDLAAGLAALAAQTPARLAVTDGARGVFWLEQGAVRTMPAFAVIAVDTLGAGDVFHGACVLALAEGQPFAAALRFAAAAAALKCSHFGGIAGAPFRAEVESLLAESRS